MNSIKDASRKIIISSRNIQNAFAQFKLPERPLENLIEIAEKDLNFVYLSSDLKFMFDEIIEEIMPMIPLEDFIIKGIFWRAIKKWQIKYQMPILATINFNRSVQLRFGAEILNDVCILLNRSLISPNKQRKKALLNEINRKIIELYEELLSVMYFLNNPLNQEYIIDFEIYNWFDGNYSLQ
ncbi:MAG: hypothetical protein ACXACU_05570 [Candidatus Hodarchaeales archaeon]